MLSADVFTLGFTKLTDVAIHCLVKLVSIYFYVILNRRPLMLA